MADVNLSKAVRSNLLSLQSTASSMYIHESVERLTQDYFQLVNDIITAAPSTIRIVDEINNEILTGSLYKALKAAKKLIQYEQELLGNAE